MTFRRFTQFAAWAATLVDFATLPKASLAQSQVIINEIDYVQPGASDSLEWIALRNLN